MYKLIVMLILGIVGCMLPTLVAALRDPTQPPNSTSYTNLGSNLKIDAIFFNKDNTDKSIVIIGGCKFMVGDKINDAILIEIKPHEIKLKDEQGVFTVIMPYIPIKSQTTKTNKQPDL